MGDVILKGKGVWFTHPESGEKIPLSFPLNPKMAEQFNHFHINPHTHMPFEGLQHRWGPEAIAHKTALDMLKQNHPAAMGEYGKALAFARRQLNAATREFNAKRPGMPPVPLPFVETNGGVPTPEVNSHYKGNHYGAYQVKATPAHERQTHDSKGQFITMHANNAIGKLGRHPETMAFPQFEEYGRRMDQNGVKTVMGTQPHIEPQHVVMDDEGNSPLKRYSSFARDPQGDASSMGTHSRLAMDESRHYMPVNPSSAVHMLPKAFFVPTNMGRSPTKIAEKIQRTFGFSPSMAMAMAQSPFAQLAVPGGRGAGGAATQLNKLVHEMERVTQTGEGGRNRAEYKLHRDNLKHDPRWHGSTDQMHKLRKIMGMILTAEALGPQYDLNRLIPAKPDHETEQGWKEYAERTRGDVDPFSLEETGLATEAHVSTTGADKALRSGHLHHDFPAHISVADSYAPSTPPVEISDVEAGIEPREVHPIMGLRRPPVVEPMQMPARSDMFTLSEDPMDAVMRVFESVQLAEARQNPLITKDAEGYTAEHLAHTFGLEKRDVEGINATMGNWTHIAEGFQVKPHVVGVVKAALSRREE
tara:strand:+ start:10130 stop:11890 length:1761 start_codon:yes stop_codon:yes gene_type:complete